MYRIKNKKNGAILLFASTALLAVGCSGKTADTTPTSLARKGAKAVGSAAGKTGSGDQMIDPITGKPVVIDPITGLPMAIDPKTGKPISSCVVTDKTPPSAYSENCASCHGATGEKGSAPALAGKVGAGKTISLESLQKAVRSGKSGMPSFSESALSASALSQIASYLENTKNTDCTPNPMINQGNNGNMQTGDLHSSCEIPAPKNALSAQARLLTNYQIQTELIRITGEATSIGELLPGGVTNKFELTDDLELNIDKYEDLYKETLKLSGQYLGKVGYATGDFGWYKGLRHSAKVLSSAPEIDGNIEDIWSSASWVTLGSSLYAPPSSRADLSAIVGALETNTSIVFAVKVLDEQRSASAAEVYNQDSVELFLGSGATPAYPGSASQLSFKPGATPGSYTNLSSGKSLPSLKYATVSTNTGYSFEIEVSKSDLGISKLADLKLDIHVNDADASNIRESKLTWFSTTDDLWQTPSKFGSATVFLDGRSKNFSKCATEGECLSAFVSKMGRGLFRYGLSSAEINRVVNGVASASGKEKFQQAFLSLVMSPQFLFQKDIPTQAATTSSATKESILEKVAFMLTGRGTDEVSMFSLQTPLSQDNAFHVKRMVSSSEGYEKIVLALQSQYRVGDLKTLVKSGYPDFNSATAEALLSQFQMMLGQAISGDTADFRTLLSSTSYPINSVVDSTYGLNVTHTDFRTTKVDETKYSGVLTTGAYLTQNATPDDSSPVFRGVHILEDFMCYHIGPPPPGAASKVLPPKAENTVRQNFEGSTQGTCAGCHNYINPVGFTFDNFDGVGKFRTMLKGKAIDTTASLVAPLAFLGSFGNGVELSKKLSASNRFHQCFTTQIFSQMMGTKEKTLASCAVLKTGGMEAKEKYNFTQLVLKLMSTDEFTLRKFN
jgi:cytochrome c553